MGSRVANAFLLIVPVAAIRTFTVRLVSPEKMQKKSARIQIYALERGQS